MLLIDKDAMLLENLVAIQLFRIYGHDMDNGRVFFYSDGYEVDFYVPDDELAIQVSYSLREEETISDKHGTIEVMPVWKWI